MFVIAGVTGNTGKVAAETLLDQGKKVRVIVRKAEQGEPFRLRGAEVAVASLDDAAELSRALTGADGAYLLSPPDHVAEDFLATRRATVDSIAAAIEASKVPHVVFLSSIGAELPAGTGMIRSVHYAEQRLARTPAKFTFVRAATFLENWAGSLPLARSGKLPSFLTADRKFPMVATRDIGIAAARALVAPPAERISIIDLEAPEEYSPRDVAAAASRILGHPVDVEVVPEAAIESVMMGMGSSASVASLYRELFAGANAGTIRWANEGEKHVRGTTDVDAFVRSVLHS